MRIHPRKSRRGCAQTLQDSAKNLIDCLSVNLNRSAWSCRKSWLVGYQDGAAYLVLVAIEPSAVRLLHSDRAIATHGAQMPETLIDLLAVFAFVSAGGECRDGHTCLMQYGKGGRLAGVPYAGLQLTDSWGVVYVWIGRDRISWCGSRSFSIVRR